MPVKHWELLGRTLTVLNNKKGLISWSGTAFEYLMPNINIPRYKGSLLDESIKFAIMSQMEYAEALNIPWGISETAFSVKDLHSNYQYKAFGIPWLGLKRGLADDIVISSYASILAIIFLFVNMPYPFMPIQLTLISTVTIGIPSFVLALEPNKERIKGKFLRNVISRALRNSFNSCN